MEDIYVTEDLRRRLVLAGFSELVEHGVGDFSLRRVAIAAGVSCAAPYRHFKDKDELILAVIRYVRENWDNLAIEVVVAYGQGSPECIAEMCKLAVRFWLGNGRFRSVFLLANDGASPALLSEIEGFDVMIKKNIHTFTYLREINEEDESVITATVLSLTYGTIFRVAAGFTDTELALANLKNKIISEFLLYP